ncbi:unnamed protein product [Fraxinus pennsylvanica]|uniref:Uncharacterized protein n=1 Tax=Fraxinus pennsylvanica TaxID=56036 RepID=A0AAD1YJW4_9LAMI|nr:unnamed protein product [Fraxinus pennsylvanica]
MFEEREGEETEPMPLHSMTFKSSPLGSGDSRIGNGLKKGYGVKMEKEWRKGPWIPEEDKLLSEYVSQNGEGRWSSVARCAGLNRNAKSCRLRWVNYLRPGLKRGHITAQEEGIIIELHALWGNKWSTIARYLPGRTDNEIKNYWRTHFKKIRKASERQERRKNLQQTQQKQKEENYEDKKVEAISNERDQFEKNDVLRRSITYARGNNEEEFEKARVRWMETESEWISLTDELRVDLESIRQRLRRSITYARGNNEEEFEKERVGWMEMESEWISLTDELRIDLESIRQRA